MDASMRLVELPDLWEFRVPIRNGSGSLALHRQWTFRGSRHQAERELGRLIAARDIGAPQLREQSVPDTEPTVQT